MGNYALNIGRQLGSGGREIGKMVSRKLGIAYYDKELIQIASRESGLGKQFFEQADEKSTFNFWNDFAAGIGAWPNYYGPNYLFNESLFKFQSDVIKELAGRESCLFVGRCADYVLRNHPRCINIFISADVTTRAERLMRTHNHREPKDKILEMMQKTDKKRSQYYNYYSNKKWGEASSYHLCINSSVLGIEKTADFIVAFAKEKFHLQ